MSYQVISLCNKSPNDITKYNDYQDNKNFFNNIHRFYIMYGQTNIINKYIYNL
jgi:hypothetical protein